MCVLDPFLSLHFAVRIVTYKTALYTFYLPAACAMYLCGLDGEKQHEIARDVSIQLGRYFQIQDDYLDCYGAPEVRNPRVRI